MNAHTTFPRTLVDHANDAFTADMIATDAMNAGGECHAQENAAMNARARFWAALEARTQLTEEHIRRLL